MGVCVGEERMKAVIKNRKISRVSYEENGLICSVLHFYN